MELLNFFEKYCILKKYKDVSHKLIYEEFMDNFGCDIDEVAISKASDFIIENIFRGFTVYGGGINLSINLKNGKITIKLEVDKNIFRTDNLKKFFPKTIVLYNVDKDNISNLLRIAYMIDCKIVDSILYMSEYDYFVKHETEMKIM
ncbi:MAG: hypothetical protein QXD03_03300 [Candidatus Anstonellales archaeon]